MQSPERLKLLLVLTVADIRAVGPSAWNGWKGQLLRGLYFETEPVVAGGHTQLASRDRIAAAQAAFRAAVADWPPEEVERFVEPALSRLLAQDRDAQGRRSTSSSPRGRAGGREARPAPSPPTPSPPSPSFRCSRPTIPRLLALFAGACAASGANISGAHISTTRDGFALDTFLLAREFDQDEDELRRARRIAETIENLLKGESRLGALMAKRRERRGRIGAFKVAPEVLVDNALSNQFTVIEVAGLDRPGLLFELTNSLSDLNLDITSAHITTFGEKAVDVFYVTDLTNKKIASPQRQKAIRQRLLEVLGESRAGDASLARPSSGPLP